MMEPVRKIGNEIFRKDGFDGIWWLGNAGFLIRADNKYLMIVPVVTDIDHLWRRTHEFPLEPGEIEKADCVLYARACGSYGQGPVPPAASWTPPYARLNTAYAPDTVWQGGHPAEISCRHGR